MILRIFLVCLVIFSVGSKEISALDSNYPIFNADDGLPSSSSTEKLNKILGLSEQQLKRIEAVDYK